MLVIAEFNNTVIYLRQYGEINKIVTGFQEGRYYGNYFNLLFDFTRLSIYYKNTENLMKSIHPLIFQLDTSNFSQTFSMLKLLSSAIKIKSLLKIEKKK